MSYVIPAQHIIRPLPDEIIASFNGYFGPESILLFDRYIYAQIPDGRFINHVLRVVSEGVGNGSGHDHYFQAQTTTDNPTVDFAKFLDRELRNVRLDRISIATIDDVERLERNGAYPPTFRGLATTAINDIQ